jgi:hypothetical protein
MRRFVLFLGCLIAGCASSSTSTTASGPRPSGTSVEPAGEVEITRGGDGGGGRGWRGFDKTATKFTRALADDLDCDKMREMCVIGVGWGTAEPYEIPDGQHVIAGVTFAFAEGHATEEAFSRPSIVSLMSVNKADGAVRVRLVQEKPTSKQEIAEVTDAAGWFYGFLVGEAPGMRLVGGLARQAEGVRGTADVATETSKQGLRFVLPDGSHGELRRVGRVFVVIVQPPGVDGVLMTLLTETLQIDPEGKPGK